MDPKGFLQKLLRRVGLDVRRYDLQQDAVLRRQLLLTHYDVGLVLDVGANAGQYARLLRRGGYARQIVSFEPQSSAFALLQQRAGRGGSAPSDRFLLGMSGSAAAVYDTDVFSLR